MTNCVICLRETRIFSLSIILTVWFRDVFKAPMRTVYTAKSRHSSYIVYALPNQYPYFLIKHERRQLVGQPRGGTVADVGLLKTRFF